MENLLRKAKALIRQCAGLCELHMMHNARKMEAIYLYDFDSLKSHFYIVKLGFTGVYIIFLIAAQNHRLWVLIRTASVRRF